MAVFLAPLSVVSCDTRLGIYMFHLLSFSTLKMELQDTTVGVSQFVMLEILSLLLILM